MSDSEVLESELSVDPAESDNSTNGSYSDVRRGAPARGRGRPRSRGGTRSRRGRGRARGSTSGRGRGTRRTVRSTTTTPDPEDVLQQRKEFAKDKVENMSEREAKDFLLEVVERHPTFVLDVMETTDVQPQGHHPPPAAGGQNLPWCSCGKCRDMPTPEERVCCGRNPDACLSLVPDFNILVLDEAVLALGRLYRQDALVFPEDENYNKANRHQAYRQYTLWVHGRLRVGERKVVPSCCTWKIRDKYPDPYGQYVGYSAGRLN
ncbi:P2X purinoceptor 7-like [Argopecten irradians]|uniref:P2X purinoceptor 7-like n=2 Tax=Argopecten irradians TaxID=31199 RepID=UPI003720BB66